MQCTAGGADANKSVLRFNRPRGVYSLARSLKNAEDRRHFVFQQNSVQNYGQAESLAPLLPRRSHSRSASFRNQVNGKAVADLCGNSKTPGGFPCVVRYVIGTGSLKSAKESRQEARRQDARQGFSQFLVRAKGSASAFEAFNIGGEIMLRWKGGTSA